MKTEADANVWADWLAIWRAHDIRAWNRAWTRIPRETRLSLAHGYQRGHRDALERLQFPVQARGTLVDLL
jgi:hypothetical protein